MPIYEYRCGNCSTTYEDLRKISERDATYNCSKSDCGGLAERIMSSPIISNKENRVVGDTMDRLSGLPRRNV